MRPQVTIKAVVFVLIVNLVLGASAPAVDTIWQADVNNWSIAANWNNGEPLADVNAIVNNDGTVEIDQAGEVCLNLILGNLTGFGGTVSMTAGALNVAEDVNGFGPGTSRLELDGGTLTVSGDIRLDRMFLGISNTGVVYIQPNPQVVDITRLFIGDEATGGGTYTKNSNGLLDTGELYVGLDGTGVFNHNAGNVDNFRLDVATQTGSTGNYNLNNPGCVLESGTESIGRSGIGTFTQNNGTNRISNLLYLGEFADGNGTYNLNAGNLEGAGGGAVNREYIGNLGIGDFNHVSGNNAANALYLGWGGSATGTYDLQAGSLTTTLEEVGRSGRGTFTQNGGTNNTQELFLSLNTDSRGTYNLNNGTLLAGTAEYVGIRDFASFVHNNGDNTTGSLYIDTNSVYTLGGGQLTVNEREYLETEGRFIQNGGVHNVNDILYLGRSGEPNVAYELTDGSLTVGDPCAVPYPGTLHWASPGSEYIGFRSLGLGTFTQTGGTNTAYNNLYVGYQHYSAGIYDQSTGDGDTVVGNDLFIALNAWSRGEYRLGETSDVIVGRDEYIGWGGNGRFIQNGGENNCNKLSVGLHLPSSGLYTLNEGDLGANEEYIAQNGHFLQNGGTNTTGKLYLGRFVGFKWGLTWGWQPTAPPDPWVNFRIARYTKNGGALFVTNPACAYIGYEGTGAFEHYDGNNVITGSLHVGNAADSAGKYVLDINNAGLLEVENEIRIGADSGLGRFEWFNGDINVPNCTLGNNGTLAMGFDFNVNDLASGALFVGGATNVTGLDEGMLEVTNGATATNNQSRTLRAVRVGSNTGAGTFMQNGGSNNIINYLEIDPNGRYVYSGGNLDIYDGGLHIAGEFDFTNSFRTLDVGSSSLVNLVDANFTNCSNASFNINSSDCLTILPVGFSPGQFYSYTNYGREHTDGNTLEFSSSDSYTFQGIIGDHVKCFGNSSLRATTDGYLNLLDGLELSGFSDVNLGSGVVAINDSNSGIDSANAKLAGDSMFVGIDGGTGSFVQNDGNAVISSDVLLGYGSGSNGYYSLDNGGSLEAGSIYVGFDANGTFDHNVGNVNARHDLFVGYGPDSNGLYVSWAVTTNIISGFVCSTIGYEGTGQFIQQNGTHNAGGALNMGVKEGSSGTYKIYKGNLETDQLNVGLMGDGRFEILQAPDPNITVKELLNFGPNSIFVAVEGSTIHMNSAAFDNQNIDPNDLEGLSNLMLIFEGGSADPNTYQFEVSGKDIGAGLIGFETNFALEALDIGGTDIGRIQLVDRYYNQMDGDSNEALYVYNLNIGPGSYLDLNGLNLYYVNSSIDGTATIDENSGTIAEILLGDFEPDGDVDLVDFASFALRWKGTGCGICGAADLTDDGNVDIYDLQKFTDNWLAGK